VTVVCTKINLGWKGLRVIPQTLEYLRIYALKRTHIEPRRQEETLKVFKRRAFSTLRTISTGGDHTPVHKNYEAPSNKRMVKSVEKPSYNMDV